MLPVPNDLRQKLHDRGQGHVLAWWDGLSAAEREALLQQLRALDLDQLGQLYNRREHTFALPAAERIAPVPVIRMGTGGHAARLMLEAPGRLFTSPNGHGGTLTALAESGLLDRLRRRGIRQVFYFQVDNPLVKVADPVFLGHHLAANAEVSSKVIPKEGPTDRLGNIVSVDR